MPLYGHIAESQNEVVIQDKVNFPYHTDIKMNRSFNDDLIDKGGVEEIREEIKSHIKETGADEGSPITTEVEGLSDACVTYQKRGKKFKEPVVTIRKSSRIHDQDISMQEKASLLKSIHNLDNKGKIANNSFIILNDTPVHYLEEVASVCGIVLGAQNVGAKDVISAMQAQELARAAIAKADWESKIKSNQDKSNIMDKGTVGRMLI